MLKPTSPLCYSGDYPFPYTSSTKFDLRSAVPPARPDSSVRFSTGTIPLPSHLLHCQFGSPTLPVTFPEITMTLEKPLSAGFDPPRITQVFTVSVLFHASFTESLMVAKFYDPLYFYERFTDSVLYAAQRTADEVEAYRRLESIQGVHIPEFYGCYVCSVPGHGRSVYVLLMQYIPGVSLSVLKPEDLTDGERKGVMDMVCRIDDKIYNLGVSKRGMKASNTVLANLVGDSGLGRWYGFSSVDLEYFRSGTVAKIRYAAPRDKRANVLSDVVLVDFASVWMFDVGSRRHEVMREECGLRAGGGDRCRDFKVKGWME